MTREHVRMALGQLLDYGRFAPDATPTILLPSEPLTDLMALIHAAAVTAIWDQAGQFHTTTGPYFT